MSSGTQVKNAFKDQTIFLTGATGFVGKVLIEKLLRVCKDLKRIYILVRPKKGKNLEERYDDIFKHECFDLLKAENADLKEKVWLVGGDCERPLLGISKDDLTVLKTETNIIIHVAASVKFDQSLKTVVFTARGTKDLMELAKEMANFKAFVYVSTAFSHCIESHVREKVYDPPIRLQTLLDLVEAFDEKVLERITPALLGKWPNTYVYSKSISESVVGSAANLFPVVIVRPGIIINSAEEPVEGWIDNIYGPIGISIGGASGLIRSMHVKNEAIVYAVPVDYVCNCVLAATWKAINEKCLETKVYNYIRFNNELISWGKYLSVANSNYWRFGVNTCIWYNTFQYRENKLWNDVCIFWLHTIPAYLVDGVLFCLQKQTRAIKTYQKINKTLSLLSYFCTRTWIFDDDNVSALWDAMSEDDQKSFKFRNDDLEWEDFFRVCVLGAKRYLLKEPVEGSLKRGSKLVSLMAIHYAFLTLFWYRVYKLLPFAARLFWQKKKKL